MKDFWSLIKKEACGCWVWQGRKRSSNRYGVYWNGKKNVSSHRHAYSLYYGPIPEKMLICHTCDNGLCCNPDHMFYGTALENSLDMVSKGRQPKSCTTGKGINNGHALLTESTVIEIRRARECGLSYSQIASAFSLKSKGHAHSIATRKIWNHI